MEEQSEECTNALVLEDTEGEKIPDGKAKPLVSHNQGVWLQLEAKYQKSGPACGLSGQKL